MIDDKVKKIDALVKAKEKAINFLEGQGYATREQISCAVGNSRLKASEIYGVFQELEDEGWGRFEGKRLFRDGFDYNEARTDIRNRAIQVINKMIEKNEVISVREVQQRLGGGYSSVTVKSIFNQLQSQGIGVVHSRAKNSDVFVRTGSEFKGKERRSDEKLIMDWLEKTSESQEVITPNDVLKHTKREITVEKVITWMEIFASIHKGYVIDQTNYGSGVILRRI